MTTATESRTTQQDQRDDQRDDQRQGQDFSQQYLDPSQLAGAPHIGFNTLDAQVAWAAYFDQVEASTRTARRVTETMLIAAQRGQIASQVINQLLGSGAVKTAIQHEVSRQVREEVSKLQRNSSRS